MMINLLTFTILNFSCRPPKPIFETDPDRLSFSTTLLIHPYFLAQTIDASENKDDGTVNEAVNGTVNETE